MISVWKSMILTDREVILGPYNLYYISDSNIGEHSFVSLPDFWKMLRYASKT